MAIGRGVYRGRRRQRGTGVYVGRRRQAGKGKRGGIVPILPVIGAVGKFLLPKILKGVAGTALSGGLNWLWKKIKGGNRRKLTNKEKERLKKFMPKLSNQQQRAVNQFFKL